MLEPGGRLVYLEALKPPPGYALDRAVGTTFSLDLPTLLAVPLGFALLDYEDSAGELRLDPVTVLHALRHYADRITVFCHAGRIAAPARRHLLYSHLEGMIVEAQPPSGDGVFHPKTWLLRLTSPDGPVRYRFLCLTRNLTSDRSWDTILVLEGQLGDRERAVTRSRPLAEFLEALPALAVRPVTEQVRESVVLMAEEVRRVRFEPPAPFEEVAGFHPLGLEGSREKVLGGPAKRLLVVAPFVNESFLKLLLGSDGRDSCDVTLVSRPDVLETLSPALLRRVTQVLVLDDAADEEPTETESETPPAEDRRGLHAKLFIADQGWDAAVWTGSANATDAAFGSNVEFLVQLKGKRSKVGVDAFLEGGPGCRGFGSLLRPFPIPDTKVPVDQELLRNEERLEAVRRSIARGDLRLAVHDTGPDGRHVTVLSASRPLSACEGTAVVCWPISLNRDHALALDPLTRGERIPFPPITVQALTSFVAFEVTVGSGSRMVVRSFVLDLPLDNAPPGRFDAILQAVIGDKNRLLRYLLFLLAGEDEASAAGAGWILQESGSATSSRRTGPPVLPLFEQLLRAFVRTPEKLDQVERLVTDLRRTSEGRALLPDHFDAIWEPLRRARHGSQETPP